MTPLNELILSHLKALTEHQFVKLTDRGNTAITAALSAVFTPAHIPAHIPALSVIPPTKKLLIPSEGGWIHYQKAPKKLGVLHEEVACDDAKINLQDLQKKLITGNFGALLYQNPGGYFAEQPMHEIYALCQKHNCPVVMDVSGAIGTPLCDGKYADFLVCSFGEDKLVNAGVGGFVSCKNEALFDKISLPLFAEEKLKIILEKLEKLPERIAFLKEKRKKIIEDLKEFESMKGFEGVQVVYPNDLGFVVVVRLPEKSSERDFSEEKEKLINYCKQNDLPWTECPRYIRLNKPAISIEIKKA